jgi:putative hydrolase of HD superfamily
VSRLSEFLFEAAALKRTPRTGYQFLGRGRENVAEHSFGTTAIAFVLGRMAGDADLERLLLLALFHDLAEARTGDLNYVNKRYVTADEREAFEAATRDLPFGEELRSINDEWLEGRSREASLAADADQLDMILELRRLLGHGWKQAGEWLGYATKRLRTEEGRRLCEDIMTGGPDDWWFERSDALWVRPGRPPRGGREGE